MADKNNRFTFVVSDESLNKYGSRVLTEGIDIEEFKANPVMFWNHKRDEDGLFGSSARDRMPIGRWENIRKEGGRLIADAVLDLNDNTGKKVAQKLADGFLNASSIGIGVMELSENPDMMLKGQTRPTITQSKLMEISIVDVPANGNALKLSFPLMSNTLTLDVNTPMEKINELLPTIKLGASLARTLDEAIDNMVTDDRTRGDIISAMGNAAGISANTVQNILSENIDCPPLQRLEGFASVLNGVSVNDLRNAAERDGCEYGEENNFKEMTIQEQINSSLNGFFDKLKESFNFSPKEETTGAKPETVMADLFVELNANLQAIELPTAPDNSEQFAALNASIEKLTAANEAQAEQVESMKGEIIELRGRKGGAEMPNDAAPISEKNEETKKPSIEDEKFAALGQLFNSYQKR